MWGFQVNPTALIPVAQPGDIRQDRVGQLVKRLLDGMTSDETRRAYSHALEMFLAFCGREGNPMLSAELVASYRVSLVGEGKSSSTVGVHLAAIKALTRSAVMAGLMPAATAASINDVKGAPRRGSRIGNWLTREQAQELLSLPDRESLKGKRDYAILALLLGWPDGARLRGEGRRHRSAGEPLGVGRHHGKREPGSFGCRPRLGQSSDRRLDHRGRHERGEDLSRGAQGWQNVGPGSYARCGAADRSALRARHGSREIGTA
ncbi:MAG: hypothetical protein QOH35_144 [Acidobacteriaceae bacterium]|jgi:hypothetical protein|nr:hypothetical protein [Acidobacteriaceae bacterium]